MKSGIKVVTLVLILCAEEAHFDASAPQVTCTSTSPAVLGGDITLTCEFNANLDILQVTWQKKRGKDIQNMVTCSEKYGVNVAKPFEQHITVVNSNSVMSSIRISKLEREDEACYHCLFNAYPNGAYTGGVCLEELQVANEVFCNAMGHGLRVELDPRVIQTRQSVEHAKTKSRVPEVFSVQGHFTDTSIHPRCTFQLGKGKRRKRNAQDPVQGADEVVYTECKASGTVNFDIRWQNEGQPFSRETRKNTTGNITTVTSTLMHTLPSFPADSQIFCDIIHTSSLEAEPADTAVAGQLSNTDSNQDDSGEQNHSWKRLLIVIVAAAALIGILFLIFYMARKKTESKTPRKLDKAENGHATPLNGDKEKPKEDPLSSLKKRQVHPKDKPTGRRKLAFTEKSPGQGHPSSPSPLAWNTSPTPHKVFSKEP